jgi:hypothetical protein
MPQIDLDATPLELLRGGGPADGGNGIGVQ